MCGHDELITQCWLDDMKIVMSLVFAYNGCELRSSIKNFLFFVFSCNGCELGWVQRKFSTLYVIRKESKSSKIDLSSTQKKWRIFFIIFQHFKYIYTLNIVALSSFVFFAFAHFVVYIALIIIEQTRNLQFFFLFLFTLLLGWKEKDNIVQHGRK
jgi:hypothetical protein